MTRLILSAILLLSFSVPVLALPPIGENSYIVESFVAGRAGDVIRKTCPSISARMFVVYSELKALERHARDQGYTEADFKAFRENKAEKDRIKAMAAKYLKAAGAVEGDAETYCKVGRDEIAKASRMGKLLRSWK